MEPKKYTGEQLRALADDPVFQSKVATDEELNKLFDPSLSDEESQAGLSSLGGCLMVCNVPVPPPTLGAVRLLKLIESPFILAKGDFSNDPYGAVCQALYVLCTGSAAVQPLGGMFLYKEQVALYKKLALEQNREVFVTRLLQAERYLADEVAAFEVAVAKFCEAHGVRIAPGENISDAIRKINALLASAMLGFDMFPTAIAQGDNNVPVWGNEHEATVISLVCEANPAATVEDIRWKIPLVTAGMLSVAGARKRGGKGIMVKPKSGLCFDRLNKLMDARLAELKQETQELKT